MKTLTDAGWYLTLARSILGLLACGALLAPPARGAAVPWSDYRAAELQLRETRRERAVAHAAIRVLGQRADWSANPAAREAGQRLADAEAAYRSALTTNGLIAVEKQREQADQARRVAIEKNIAGEPAYAALLADLARVKTERDALATLKTLSPADAKKLAAAQIRTDELEGIRDSQIGAMWSHDAASNEVEVCTALYTQWQEAHAQGKPAAVARAAIQPARTNLAAVYERELSATEPGKALLAEREALDRRIAELTTRLDGLRQAGFGEKSQWKRVEASFDAPPGKDGKPSGQIKVSFWHLPEVKLIRGLIVRALDHPLILMAAADQDLAFVSVDAPRGVDILTGDPSLFDRGLAKAAEASGHPEVAYLPFLTKGTSAGVLFARNMGFWKPERCIGVVHHAGGNLHHERGSPARTMPHVPFLAINGEFERYGPEGGGHSSGIYGIRGAYGKQTQWVMCREQLLRMRRHDVNHLISMVVQPRGDHATWDDDMWWITAMFVRKAAAARIPAMTAPPARTVLCVPLTPPDGWLSDSRLDHPRRPPASYADYPGDKVEAFWHLDKEMAEAVAAYHQGQFYLPDLSLKTPVPPDWGVVRY